MTEWLHAFVQQIIEFAGSNPTMVGLILCFSAGAEAVLLVGALVPGEALVLGVAAAAGAAGLDLLPMVIWTTVGAVIGDGISYWIGHAKGDVITNWSYLKKRPHLMQQGERFIEKHGVKAILIARFLPGLRAIVPVAAGVLGMEPKRFYAANVISAFGWAVLHILPAAGLGVAYNTLGAVSGRLAALVVLLIIALLAFIWIIRLLVNKGMPLLALAYAKTIHGLADLPFGTTKRLAGWLDPDHPKLMGMAFWAALLLATMAGFLKVMEDLISGDPLVRADIAINHLMQSLRTQPMDAVMVLITTMGDALPLLIAAGMLIGLLLVQRNWQTAGAAALAIGAAIVFVPIIKQILHKPRPIDLYNGANSFSFPSGHVTLSTVLFGVLAVLITRHLSTRWKIVIYALIGLWVSAIGLSRIYLSAHWPSDVMGGMLFGAMLTAGFALLVEHMDNKSYSRSLLAVAVLSVFITVGGWHAYAQYDKNIARYAPQPTLNQLSFADWQAKDWQELPRTRIDLKGEKEEVFRLQWTGSIATLTKKMQEISFRKAQAFSPFHALKLLSPTTQLSELAPLPLMHNGQFPEVTYMITGLGKKERLILRFWRSDHIIKRPDADAPLWLGSLRREVLTHPLGLATALRQRNPDPEKLKWFAGILKLLRTLCMKKSAADGPLLLLAKN
ncbi:MAG: VTT domain-containing protein [Hyphomicrobiaceae bacterium]|nr:VTT domain-containing protein [Hyphomicrobiaceae bacterium]